MLPAIAMGGLIIPGRTSFFQICLYMAPCEQSVCLHSLRDVCDGNWRGDCAINPKISLKLSYVSRRFMAALWALSFLLLTGIHHAVHNADPDSLLACKDVRLTRPSFNLPLANKYRVV